MIALLVHEGAPLAPHDLAGAWAVEPGPVAALLGAAVLYTAGRRRARRAGSRHPERGRWESRAFWAGWMVLAVALLSPLHPLGGALLWAHMVQHELLMVVAAPLLVLGRPLLVSLRGLPPRARNVAGGWVRRLRPLTRRAARVEVAWALHAVAIIGWHVPALYDRSVTSEAVHALQHGSFLGTGLLFWFSVLGEARHRGHHGGAILSLFTTAIYTGGLGALLTVAQTPWYGAYGAAAPLWGLTPLEDQQLAGVIMWVPAGLSYLAATLWLVLAWLRESEARVVRLERLRRGAVLLPMLVLLLAGCESRPALSRAEAAWLTGGDPDRGRHAIRSYGCGTCHSIRGVPGADGLVGPPLDGIGARAYVAGVLTNTPANLVRWIRQPREVDPLTAMPDVGVSVPDARDIAAFLYTVP